MSIAPRTFFYKEVSTGSLHMQTNTVRNSLSSSSELSKIRSQSSQNSTDFKVILYTVQRYGRFMKIWIIFG